MRPFASFLKPLLVPARLYRHRYLILQLTRRELASRYRGSYLGAFWTVLTPLVMLGVYTFIFSVVFQARWGQGPAEVSDKFGYALNLYMGMLTFNIFGETANASASVIVHNANYVKRALFPLEVLPVSTLLGVLVNAFMGLCVLVAGVLIARHGLFWTAIMLPVVWAEVALFSLGFGYFLASLGVFVRDVGSAVGLVTTMLFFLSPIFYPVEAVPEQFRVMISVNPLALYIEQARQVMLQGAVPSLASLACGFALAGAAFLLGFAWFSRTRKYFSDVI